MKQEKLNLVLDVYDLLQNLNFNRNKMNLILKNMIDYYHDDIPFQRIFNIFLEITDKFTEHFNWICEKQIESVTLFDVYKCFSIIHREEKIQHCTIQIHNKDTVLSTVLSLNDVLYIINKIRSNPNEYSDPFKMPWEWRNVNSEYILSNFLREYNALCTELVQYLSSVPDDLKLFKEVHPTRNYLITKKM